MCAERSSSRRSSAASRRPGRQYTSAKVLAGAARTHARTSFERIRDAKASDLLLHGRDLLLERGDVGLDRRALLHDEIESLDLFAIGKGVHLERASVWPLSAP